MRIIPPKKREPAGDVEIIPQPDDLKRRALVVDGDYEDAATPAVRRAQNALERVRTQAREAFAAEGARLFAAFADHARDPRDGAARERVFRAAQDLRGLSPELGEAVAGRIAASLARLLGLCHAPSPALVRAHVDALRAALRDGAAGRMDPLAEQVADELEKRANEAIARNSGG